MVNVDQWVNVFEEANPLPGCSEDGIWELLVSVARPLNDEEREYLAPIVARNPFPPNTPGHDTWVPSNPQSWPWPSRGLPASYLSFLRWSNGGTFGNKRRRVEFVEFDPTREISLRNIMLTYLYPLGAPHVVPFGYDARNGNAYYGFDTSCEPVDGEFPVVYVPFGGAMWVRLVLATNFLEFCKGTERSDEEWYWDWYGRTHCNSPANTQEAE